jgi:hypothetical protein
MAAPFCRAGAVGFAPPVLQRRNLLYDINALFAAPNLPDAAGHKIMPAGPGSARDMRNVRPGRQDHPAAGRCRTLPDRAGTTVQDS